jgi:DNA (cytosine-5)-methyltransferase 1
MNFYNDINDEACDWMRDLIHARLIPDGVVSNTPIQNINPHDLVNFTQCHFFCGISGWPLALQLAGIPPERPLWTGSCPCQPFSVGSEEQLGVADERHLWPAFDALIEARRPPVVFGEQVANAINHGWLDEVLTCLGNKDYSTGAAILPANLMGADHERKRLYWSAYASGPRWDRYFNEWRALSKHAAEAHDLHGDPFAQARRALAGDFSGLLPVDGVPVELERSALHGYGNAIVPQVGAAFIQAAEEARFDLGRTDLGRNDGDSVNTEEMEIL